ncbi:MAG: leucyl aminopeptidase [Burkholderiaceae bacterium]|nr:leucyl aminopeptidase [Burkholderiaceae bacterium]
MTAPAAPKDLKEPKDPGEHREVAQFVASNKPVDRATADCVWVGIFATGTGAVELSNAAKVLDKVSNGAVARAIKAGDIDGKAGNNLLLRDLTGLPSPRALLVGLGKREDFTDKVFCDAIRSAVKSVSGSKGIKRIASFLTDVPVKTRAGERSGAWRVTAHVTCVRESGYRFERFKTKKDDISQDGAAKTKSAKTATDNGITHVEMLLPGDMRPTEAPKIIEDAQALANGLQLTKDLANLPPNVCTPTFLANQAKTLAREFRLKSEILDRAAMEKLGMGALLAVAQGSAQPPQFIVLQHQGATTKDAPHVLVGKGITFDTGGISIKPAADMDEMKFDMSGAATVLGVMRAVAEMGLKRNVIGVIPTCENMPSGTATRPGDIVTSMSGQTVEILNTDAEGRLILCDALTYVEKFKPATVIDIATLTGACVIALGGINSGLFSPDDSLADALLKAGQDALDPAWRMPLQEEYQEQLKSPFADMANVGGRAAGSVTAACFLWRFTKAYRWAHLDIAGTAWKSGAAKGATGRPVSLLVEFLKNGLE